MTDKLPNEILNQKEKYTAPEIEIIELNSADVIFTSGQNCPIDYHNTNPFFSGMPVRC